jgi:hypothetical protein
MEYNCTLNWEMLSVAKPINPKGLGREVWRNGWRTIVKIISEDGQEELTPFNPCWSLFSTLATDIATKANAPIELVQSLLPGEKTTLSSYCGIPKLSDWIAILGNEGFELWITRPEVEDAETACAGQLARIIFGYCTLANMLCEGDIRCAENNLAIREALSEELYDETNQTVNAE